MNPYAVSTITQQARPKATVGYYAVAAYLVYASVVIYNLGGLPQNPIALAIEACLIFAVSGIAAWIGSYWLDCEISAKSTVVSRLLGGIAFGTSFVTCQPYVLLPYFTGLLTPLERTPLDAIAHFYGSIFDQPYILIPTTILSGIAAWTAERLWRSRFFQKTSDEPRIAPEFR